MLARCVTQVSPVIRTGGSPNGKPNLVTNIDTYRGCHPEMNLPSPPRRLSSPSNSDATSSRKSSEGSKTMTLPPIRQIFPMEFGESQTSTPTSQNPSSESRPYSPPAGSGGLHINQLLSPPLSKRRRLSEDDNHSDGSPEGRQPIPIEINPPIYGGPISPTSTSPTTVSSIDGLHIKIESSYLPSLAQSTHISPPISEPPAGYQMLRSERPTLPSLSTFADRTERYYPSSDYTYEVPLDVTSRSIHPPSQSYTCEPMVYGQPYPYGYQPPRGQPYPTHPLHDRTPFSHGGYPQPFFHEGYHHEIGHDSKQRKRRGNLPKDTTDKLRAWFMNHLTHPYPSEDEKQDLMRQTGLAMNQISNWFINARRRHLPAIVNSARAEAEHARSTQMSDGRADERKPYPVGDRKYSVDDRKFSVDDNIYSPESDEGSSYHTYGGPGNLKREVKSEQI